MIEITHYKAVNRNSLLATFSIKVQKWGDAIIRDMNLFQKGNQKWISFPSRAYEVDGQKKYFSYFGFVDIEMQKKFLEKVMEALEEHIKKNEILDAPVQGDIFEEVPF